MADEDGGSEYKTTKYVFISWVGPKVKPLVKARSSQVRVALYKHAKVTISQMMEDIRDCLTFLLNRISFSSLPRFRLLSILKSLKTSSSRNLMLPFKSIQCLPHKV